MKNFIFTVIGLMTLLTFSSCDKEKDIYGNPTGPQVSGTVTVHIGNDPYPIATMPSVVEGILYLPISEVLWFTDYSLEYPNQRYKVLVKIGTETFQVATTQAQIYQMRTYAVNQGMQSLFVQVGSLTGHGYTVPEIVGYW